LWHGHRVYASSSEENFVAMVAVSKTIGSFSNSPYYFDHQQTGGDGKYEVLPSGIRVKWNNYYKRVYEEFLTPNSGFGVYAMYGDNSSALFGWDDNRSVALENKLVSKIKDHDFNLAVAVAEGSQTVKLVVNTIRTFNSALKDLHRGNITSAIRRFSWNSGHAAPSSLTGRTVASRWLELQYGWLPLLSDCYEAARAFEKLSHSPRTFSVRVSKHIDSVYDSSQAPSNYSLLRRFHTSKSIIYEASENMSAQRSLGLSDPLSVAWEITPFSFVADWFIPIGVYLENLNTIPNLKGRFCVTEYSRSEGSSVFVGPEVVLPAYLGASAKTSSIYINRIVSEKLAATMPSFKKLPQAMSPLHVANAIALLRLQLN